MDAAAARPSLESPVPEPVRVLELRSVRGTGGGPEKTLLFGTAQSDRSRFAVTLCYIRDARDDIFFIHDLAARHQIDYVEVVERHSFDPSIWPTLRRLVRERAIDIVHAHDYKTDLLALGLARAEGIVPLATAHGWTGHTWREQFYYFADKRLLARFPRVIAVSSEIRGALVQAGASAERVTVVPNGIDPGRFVRDPARAAAERLAGGFSPGDRLIGAVGRLEPQKRFDLLIEATAELRRRRPEVRLLIAGDGSLRLTLQKLADRLAPGAILFPGHVNDVIGFHHLLDVFVQSSDYEGTPNSVLEAMALETPIVATDAGGTIDLVQPGVHGLVVAPGNVRELVRAIDAVLDDPVAATDRAHAARRRVEHELSFRARMAAVEGIFTQLVEGRERAAESRATA